MFLFNLQKIFLSNCEREKKKENPFEGTKQRQYWRLLKSVLTFAERNCFPLLIPRGHSAQKASKIPSILTLLTKMLFFTIHTMYLDSLFVGLSLSGHLKTNKKNPIISNLNCL